MPNTKSAIRADRPATKRTPRSRLARSTGALLATSALVAGPVVALAASSAEAAAQTTAPGLIYDGSGQLAAGQIPFTYQSMVAGHVTVVRDPLGGGFNVMKYAVADSDRPYSGASNPRADFETPRVYTDGSDLYTSMKFMEPASFPVMTTGGSAGFFQIAEIYGPPFGGSPTIGVGLFPGPGGRPEVGLGRDQTYGWDTPWKSGALNTGWHTLDLHTIMSTSASVGLVEVWLDGVKQTSLHYRTLGPSNWDGHTANNLNVNQYRRAGAYPGTVVTYQAAAKIGTSLAAVQDGGTSTTTTPTTTPTTTTTTTTTPASTLGARFTAPSTSVTGRSVTFDGSGSTGSPVKYAWSDGTHTLGSGASLPFTFHYAGTKHVKLTVTNAGGTTASVEHDVTVSVAAISANVRLRRSLQHPRHHRHHRHLSRRHHRRHRHTSAPAHRR